MANSAVSALRSYVLTSNPEAADHSLADFVSAYFSNADPNELLTRNSAALTAVAVAHRRLFDGHPNEFGSRIRVYNPSLAEDGFVCDHTVIQIVHDDMPFLVDSVTMAINRSGRVAHWIVHPLICIDRDINGNVVSSVPVSSNFDVIHRPITSLIFAECDRIFDTSECIALHNALLRVLEDVRVSVLDWSKMVDRLTAVSTSLFENSTRQECQTFCQWIQNRNFTFLGACDYDVMHDSLTVNLVPLPLSGLGLLREGHPNAANLHEFDDLNRVNSVQSLVLTKTKTRSTVHRSAWLDCIAIRRFDSGGHVIGESRFFGLYTSKAYATLVNDIPFIRSRSADVMRAACVLPDSHAAKALQSILDVYPRDELFQIDTDTLIEHAQGILMLQERQRSRVFLRRDYFGRFTSVLVFVPRDRYNTELRIKIGNVLEQCLDGLLIEFTPMLSDRPMARIHYVIKAREVAPINPDLASLELKISQLTQRWEDELKKSLFKIHGETLGAALAIRFSDSFTKAYRDDFSYITAADDVLRLSALCALNPLAVKLYRPLDCAGDLVRFKIYNATQMALSDVLPILEGMGVRVLDEQPYRVKNESSLEVFWIHDLGLKLPKHVVFAHIEARFEQLFIQVCQRHVDSDDLNKLVLVTTLDSRSISIIRAYTRYFKQLGFAYSQSYIETTLFRHAIITEQISTLFDIRFNPEEALDRSAEQQRTIECIEAQLMAVSNLDEDRILRQFLNAVIATVRTNAWQTDANGSNKPYLSFKFNPRQLSGVPDPKPLHEIWVYSPRFEAVHLRNGNVARGGLRWSDRGEDFRTEILGLVKAQQVKNTVIVPVGSKGGFVLKAAPSLLDRDAYMAEGIHCYKLFLSGMLDLTDNLVNGDVVPPSKVVRHDSDDTYLVVAADKGTASFSDIANSVSAQYGFWLGDAFASGGSVGYDHKKMGITARGAWESTKRHFRALSINTQTTPITVIGIGDMSGDVFGNGMLLSEKIQLLVAFDHRHIFIDPQPDIERSFRERQRLFALPRSSWDDFDKTLISQGGGVYARSAKSIQLSAQARAIIGIDAVEISPVNLLHAILQAPVDLIYNGGIGTYVKATLETHVQVGDKAGDAFRVNGAELRCKVLVEGGNLGCTQHGRIEFAKKGGLIYTDAIDNSAGVDCSDHEVNIKILLDRLIESGDMTLKQRNDLLSSMTQEVGQLVLADNYYQTQALNVACHRPMYLLDGQQRLMQWLEGAGRLNRAIEFLPDDAEIARRRALKLGLTAPEGAVVMAYAKMSVFDDLLISNLPDDPYFKQTLKAYFPSVLTERFAQAIEQHPLRREIVATFVANTVVNRTGATFVNFLAAEAASSTADVVRAYTLAREIFDLESFWAQIDVLDYTIGSDLQLALLGQLIAIAKRASRWMLRAHIKDTDLPTLIQRYQPGARVLRTNLKSWLPATALASWQLAAQELTQAGVTADLADNLTALDYLFPVMDMVDLAQNAAITLEHAACTYFAVDDQIGLTHWRIEINRLPTDTLWQTQARGSARDDVYAIASQITRGLVNRSQGVSDWCLQNAKPIERIRALLQSIRLQNADLAPISVALRELRHLI